MAVAVVTATAATLGGCGSCDVECTPVPRSSEVRSEALKLVVVDTAYFATVRRLDLGGVTAATVIIGLSTIGAWALARRRRGVPL